MEQETLVVESYAGVRSVHVPEIPRPSGKHAVGYCWSEGLDAIDVLIGCEGTLAVITEVELALTRKPVSCLYLLQFFFSEQEALSFVETLRGEQGLQVLAIEFSDKRSLSLLRAAGPLSSRAFCRAISMLRPEYEAAVYTEIAFEDENALGSLNERLENILSASSTSLEHSFAGIEEKEMRDMKTFRHAIPELVNATIARRKTEVPGLHKIATDMAVPDAYLHDIYKFYTEYLAVEGLEYVIFGHAGNNHFHVNMMPRNEEELARGKAIYKEFAEEVLRMGGSVSAEHGLGRIKKEYLSMQYSEREVESMRKIKACFDPKGLLNPGVLL